MASTGTGTQPAAAATVFSTAVHRAIILIRMTASAKSSALMASTATRQQVRAIVLYRQPRTTARCSTLTLARLNVSLNFASTPSTTGTSTSACAFASTRNARTHSNGVATPASVSASSTKKPVVQIKSLMRLAVAASNAPACRPKSAEQASIITLSAANANAYHNCARTKRRFGCNPAVCVFALLTFESNAHVTLLEQQLIALAAMQLARWTLRCSPSASRSVLVVHLPTTQFTASL